MYDENSYFDAAHQSMQTELDGSIVAASNCTMGTAAAGLDQNFTFEDQNNPAQESMGIELQNQLRFELDPEFNTQIIQEALQASHSQLEHHHFATTVLPPPPSVLQNWETGEMHDMVFQQQQSLNTTYSLNSSLAAPDLLNFLQLPRCSVPTVLPTTSTLPFNGINKKAISGFPNSLDIYTEIGGNDANSASSVLYDPLQLNFPPNPPLLRDLFQSLPQNYHLPNSQSGPYLGLDEKDTGGSGMLQEGDIGGCRQYGNSVLDFRREMCGMGKGEARGNHHFATEKQRRESLNEKYKALRSLVPNPTKTDRASVVGDAIDYIKELLRTVEELKILVEKKRQAGGRQKRQKHGEEDPAATEVEVSTQNKPPHGMDAAAAVRAEREQTFSGSLRSSWLQRTSKEGTWVDVRIVDDEVTIKLTQRKKKNCLLFVSKILEDLQLEILHANGANFGDHNIFLFNTKICEGSCVYASAIANKLIEGVDRSYPRFTSRI
ncbi:transcription factor bHLH91-like [Nymphaea colorata]|nr:transcription factor bHLH91-like [Nymphaea colorata]